MDAGPFHNAVAAKEMLRWVRRTMLALETYMQESNRHLVNLANNHVQVTLADIVLYQFLEFTSDCYVVDVTDGSGAKVVDVYGREVADTYPNIRRFFEAFRLRDSAKRIEEAGEVPNIKAKAVMGAWVDGVL